jgi:GAF domain-containing protein
MQNFLSSVFDVSRYQTLVEKNRAQMIYGMTALITLLYTVYTFRINPVNGLNLWQEAVSNPVWAVCLPAFYVSAIVTFVATRSGWLKLASIGPVVMWFVGAVVNSTVTNGFTLTIDGIVLIGLVLLAGLLNYERGLLLGALVGLVILAVGVSLRANLTTSPLILNRDTSLSDFFTIALVMIGGVGVVYMFLRTMYLNRLEGVIRATELTSRIDQRVSQRMSLQDVLNSAVEEMRQNYPDIHHAQIFLIDELNNTAVLQASSGDVGRLLIERDYTVEVGSQSVVGQVTAKANAIVVRAGTRESIRYWDEFLPEMVSQATLPLRTGNKVIGALDLQSRNQSAFPESDVPIFQSMADHLVIAIDNARLFEQTEERLQENQRLVEQMRNAMREVERLNEQLTGKAWAEYLRNRGEAMEKGLTFDTSLENAQWSPALSDAMRFNNVIQTKTTNRQVIATPLRVRGQVIGAMEFELEDNEYLTPEDLALINEVGDRFGVAVETARLFEQSQRIAQREALVNEIGAKLQATNDVEATLSEAARSLKEAFKAQKVSIRLGTPVNRRNGK